MGKIAFIFPGQGSQQVGMGRAMASAFREARDVFDEAEEVLPFSLSSLCFEGPQDKLQLTMNTQPAILATSIACLRVLRAKLNICPDFVAGHSLGEYSALVAAGVISLGDAVATVHKRGKYMEEAVPEGLGGMAAVLHLNREELIKVCEEISCPNYIVEPANFNCEGQIVISGHRDAVAKASDKLREVGARKVVSLPVSGPFHSSLMKPAADRLRTSLQMIRLSEADVPVIANVSAQPISCSRDIVAALIQQVYSPVLWEDSVRYLLHCGVDTFIEIGNGDVLSRLVKKTDRSVRVFGIHDPDSLQNTLNHLGG